jgi:phospholipase C
MAPCLRWCREIKSRMNECKLDTRAASAVDSNSWPLLQVLLSPRRFWTLLAVLFLCGQGVHSSDAAISTIQHIVIVFQENRSTDNLFGAFATEMPGADLAGHGLSSSGTIVALTPIPLAHTYDMDHSHAGFEDMYDKGRMDGADRVKCIALPAQPCPVDAAFAYVNGADVLPYYEIAKNYGFANHMFQTNQGPSFPAHQFIISGTSQITAKSPLFASQNMYYSGLGVGCTADLDQLVGLIGPDGTEASAVYPCFEHQALTDLLDKHKPAISWRYYAPNIPNLGIWLAPNAIDHICQPGGDPPQCTGPDWKNGSVDLDPPQILRDIASGKLSSISWVIPTLQDSDHAGERQTGSGPSWVAAIVNAIGKSKYWKDTVVIVTWDDWGGWYDHVRPPISRTNPYNYYELGFRVPLLVVSAYTKAGYISNVQHDFGSILHFAESVFDLGFIPPGTFADSRADDLADFFDFKAQPRRFVDIPAPLPSGYFLDTSRPPMSPDDD